jgi:nucleoside-diphosphate-sugar epimerase
VILVTGASGFVGTMLVSRLLREGVGVRLATRRPLSAPKGAECTAVGEIGSETDWTAALKGIDQVVHLAARVHVGNESPNAVHLYYAVNAAGAGKLAQAARATGTRSFVLISTTTVYGDRSEGTPYDERSATSPCTPYAASKLEGEKMVAQALNRSNCRLVILRPPLVYGPGAKGNFAKLVDLVRQGLPLPLASVRNRRSLVSVTNLVDAIVLSLGHARAYGTYVVSDGEDVSTPQLITMIARGLGRRARLFPCPPRAVALAAQALGFGAAARRLLGDMAVDCSRIRNELGWQPPVRTADAILASLSP